MFSDNIDSNNTVIDGKIHNINNMRTYHFDLPYTVCKRTKGINIACNILNATPKANATQLLEKLLVPTSTTAIQNANSPKNPITVIYGFILFLIFPKSASSNPVLM